MLDDGAAGLRAIQVCGGTTVVQDPADAAEPSMPRNALAATAADHVLELDNMADLLNNLASEKVDRAVEPPSWLRLEHAVSLGSEGMHVLPTIAEPSAYTCPDCGGALFELRDGLPVRFLCHTGHAFSLLSLASAQSLVADVALWAALRVVQEKEAILRHLAEVQGLDAAEERQATLIEADSLSSFAKHLRSVVVSAPTTGATEESD
jgi:two-component system chemotaxis response regulator CheB